MAQSKVFHVLIVDDEQDLREMIEEIVKSDSYKTVLAVDGQDGLAQFNAHNFDLVITDIRMPRMNGVELMKAVKAKKSVPVILITGFSELLESQSAFDLGADEYLPKPFKKDELLKAVHSLTTNNKANEGADQDNKFCRIHVTELPKGDPAPADLYFRISEAKYLKIFRKNDVIDASRLRSYIARGLTYMHVRNEDFATYVGINVNTAIANSDTKGGDVEQKRSNLKAATEALLQQIFKAGLSDDRYRDAKELMIRTIKVTETNADYEKMVFSLNDNSDVLYAHSIGVSMYSSLVARELGWTSMPILTKVSMAGLFHDIGLKEVEKKILEKRRVDMSAEEIRTFEAHVNRGREILSSIPNIPDDIISVAAQHHENCIGTGYPAKLRKPQIHPLARMIFVTDLLTHMTVKSQYDLPMSIPDALKQIYKIHLHELEPIYLAALYRVFDIEMPADLDKIWKASILGGILDKR